MRPNSAWQERGRGRREEAEGLNLDIWGKFVYPQVLLGWAWLGHQGSRVIIFVDSRMLYRDWRGVSLMTAATAAAVSMLSLPLLDINKRAQGYPEGRFYRCRLPAFVHNRKTEDRPASWSIVVSEVTTCRPGRLLGRLVEDLPILSASLRFLTPR